MTYMQPNDKPETWRRHKESIFWTRTWWTPDYWNSLCCIWNDSFNFSPQNTHWGQYDSDFCLWNMTQIWQTTREVVLIFKNIRTPLVHPCGETGNNSCNCFISWLTTGTLISHFNHLSLEGRRLPTGSTKSCSALQLPIPLPSSDKTMSTGDYASSSECCPSSSCALCLPRFARWR